MNESNDKVQTSQLASQQTQKTRDAVRATIERYLANKLAERMEKQRARTARMGRLFLILTGATLLCRAGIWGWYYLEYDINFFKPKASNYLKDRFR